MNSSNFSVIFEGIGTLYSSAMPDNLQEIKSASDQETTYQGRLEQESSLGLLQLVGQLGGFTLPAGIPDLLLSELDIKLTTTPEIGVKSFSFTGKSTLELGKKFDLLGLTVQPPDGASFTFTLERATSLSKVTEGIFALALSVPTQSSLKLSSALAWLRDVPGIDRVRELQNDDELPSESSSSSELIGLVLKPKANLPGDDVQIQLVEKSLGNNKAAKYLSNFQSGNWELDFEFVGESFAISQNEWSNGASGAGKQFTLPFLKSSGKKDLKPVPKPAQVQPVESDTSSTSSTTRSADATDNNTANTNSAQSSQANQSKLSQAITLGLPVVKGPETGIVPETGEDETFISIVFPATIKVGSLEFQTKLPVKFLLSSFAIAIDHTQGIKIFSNEPQLKPTGNNTKDYFELFGLEWRFFGAEPEDGEESNTEEVSKEDSKEYHHFTLVTESFNYQIQQAPGARIEVAYTKASRDPIIFIVEDFVVSAKGINITATVSDRPAQLNGIDTQYRFHGSQLRIVENEILDFTLSGSGPLPPKLVGDAMADISLQFRQEEGNLKLVAGAAKIQGNKLLDCKGTRFRFSVDAMGLQFINDDRFHIFFTVTGTARFALQEGDDRKNGALSLLPNIQIDLVDCPLTGDASVIAKHVQFLVELPQPISFPFLGTYEFELRAIGFLPQFDAFGGDVAMQLSGQIKFAQGKGDAANDEPDLHSLYIGLPEAGGFLPRLYMNQLPLDINMGEAFKLTGVVEFKDEETIKGFEGEGVLEIQGMPPIAASFGFYRVRGGEDQPWVRAWFIYLEVRQVSFRIPVVEFFIREVGLGFGYRYTLVGIKRADEAGSLKQLIQELKVLSRTQGDLSRRDRWAIDIGEPNQSPRWTIVLRAMIAQLSAAPSPLTWNAEKEEMLPCVYLFDAVIAFRSDLTFFMNVRGWINTSYGMYVKERSEGNELEPLFSGFVFLWPRQKRFLAHLASNPNGHLGSRPPLPEFIQSAVRSVQFSATLLIEPGLSHFELGWPNMLRWSNKIGPLNAEIRGGFIFRISTREMVIGISFLARASLEIATSIDLGLVGASVEARADAAFGARYIGLVEFATNRPTLYGAIGLELRIQLIVSLWIKIPLLFKTIKLTYSFALTINFTAGLEFAFNGVNDAGLRGSGTLAIAVMGHRLQFNVRFSSNPDAVTQAQERTQKYLNVGLEATEVEATPGIEPAAAERSSMEAAPVARSMAFVATARNVEAIAAMTMASSSENIFDTPDYSVFVIRNSGKDEYAYFVLFPRSARDEEENTRHEGFLPVPPATTVLADGDATADTNNDLRDFRLVFSPEQWPTHLEWFNPKTGDFRSVEAAQDWMTRESNSLSWRANWNCTIFEQADVFNGNTSSQNESIKLRDYLTHAYITDGQSVFPVADPDALAIAETTITDERVQNPSDDAFEAAVRGATEQFRSSPFFKRDPHCVYEQQLAAAFRPDTTIYADQEPDQPEPLNVHQQAHQVRSMVINDLIGDLRKYVDGANPAEQNQLTRHSVAFQMGLVFRVPKTDLQSVPTALDWLSHTVSNPPKLRQRTTRNSVAPDGTEERSIRTFNVLATDFSKYPPQFQRVQHFTDANTIAIAWDLEQNAIPASERQHLTPCQQDPDHNLMYYEVRRRSLNAQTPEVTYQVKGAAVLHKEQQGSQAVLNILKPRFQVVDHFTKETLDDVIRLPVTGLSYLYTITPYDFGGNAGYPLTLVATRYPNEPPAVPVDAQFAVSYLISDQIEPQVDDLTQLPLADFVKDQTGQEEDFTVVWTEPTVNGPQVPVDTYYLIFRKETTLPIGSYGLDSSTQHPRSKLLPTSNSRSLPTDIKISLNPTKTTEGGQRQRMARVPLNTLRDQGIIPQHWQPEAWKLFIQTESANGVLSALAPVQVLLKFNQTSGEDEDERQPAELEWLPKPFSLPLLPPEDQRAIVGNTHVPMPDQYQFKGATHSLSYQLHPAELRCLRFRWNQGPSQGKRYPLALTASYDLLELDIDAQTTATFANSELLFKALRLRQTVQMLSRADLLFTPNDTLSTHQWEAWYPSQVERRRQYQPLSGAQIKESPWYSWRESILVWPEWPGLTDSSGSGKRETAMHPFLEEFMQILQEQTNGTGTESLPRYRVSLQTSPPLQPQTLTTFLQSTAETADPYGWGVLQRFGLTTAFTLQEANTGNAIVGSDLLNTVDQVFNVELKRAYRLIWGDNDADFSSEDKRGLVIVTRGEDFYRVQIFNRAGIQVIDRGKNEFFPNSDLQQRLDSLFINNRIVQLQSEEERQLLIRDVATNVNYNHLDYAYIYPHLHVELLFQSAQSIRLEPGTVSPEGLLALIQISLRPAIRQVQQYYRLEIKGDSKSQIKLKFNPRSPISLIDQADPSTQSYIESSVERTVTVPLNGIVNLLIRTSELPTVVQIKESGEEEITPASIPHVSIHDALTAYFTADPTQLAADFNMPDTTNLEALTPQQRNWWRLKCYAESLNSSFKSGVKIEVPVEGKALETSLPDILLWSLRFFNAAAPPTVTNHLGETTDGPWLATAYPRVDTPAPTTPDDSGRLTYDYLITDKWAHTYRYYIRPTHRYELLWESLLKREQNVIQPDPQQGGLDVVLDRIQPVAMPVILSSTRLDPPALPGQSVPPGRTWEVIIAQHPEQILIERNQTLARQLQFRQVAFTLLRRFTYTPATGDDWVQRINALEQIKPDRPMLNLKLNAAGFPSGLPGQVDLPDHINLKRIPTNDTDLDTLTAEDIVQIEADLRSLDLPQRLGNFQQGALVLQWDTLPFFYQHQLLVIAQSDRRVSEINNVIHKDFEYRSPVPSATMTGQTVETLVLPENQPFGQLEAGTTLATLQVSLPLNWLWDSLPEMVKQQWPSEAPQTGWDNLQHWRSPSALPDLEVVYQLIQIFEGNLEVQVEALLEQSENDPEAYKLRQLGKSFLGSFDSITPPREGHSSDYILNLLLAQVSVVPLLRTYPFSPLGNRLVFDPEAQQLKWLGVMSAADRNDVQWVMAKAIAEQALLQVIGIIPPDDALTNANKQEILERWFASRLVGSDAIAFIDQPVPLPNLPGLSYVNVNVPFTLLLLDTESVNRQEIETLANDCDWKLKNALLALRGDTVAGVAIIRNAQDKFAVAAVPLLTQTDLPDLPDAKIQVNAVRSELTWLGSLSPAQAETMQGLLFDAAVTRLRTRLQDAQVSYPYTPPPAPPPVPEIPESLSSFVITVNRAEQWTLQWTGELTDENIRQIYGLIDVDSYRANAIALFRQVLAGQKGYVEELRQPVADLTSQLQRLQVQILRVETRISSINTGLSNPQMPLEQKTQLEAERRQLETQRAALRTQQRSTQQELEAAQAKLDAAQEKLNAAFSAFESLLAAEAASDILANPVANFPETTYSKTVIWLVTVPLLQSRLQEAGQSQAAAWLNRLTIPTDVGNLNWQNLDSLDARDLQAQVQQVLNPDGDSRAVQIFLVALNGLVDAIESTPFTFDYRPLQADLPESLRTQLIIRGRLLQASRSLNEQEQQQLLQRFAEQPGHQLTENSLKRLLLDLQDKTAIDRLYQRWLVQGFVPASVNLAGLSASLQAKLEAVPLPATEEYVLIWQGPLSQEERKVLQGWQSQLTDPNQNDAVAKLLQQVPRSEENSDVSLTTVIFAQGTSPDLNLPVLDNVRSRLSLGHGGTVLRYHGLMTMAEVAELRPIINDNIMLQRLFNASLTQSLQSGELRVMSRRGSAKPSDLVSILPHPLS